MPVPTGSPAVAKTIGITDVACLAASGGRVLCVTITSTLSRTNSAAISANRSLRPSAQRYSIVRLRPSLQPNSRNRWTKAAVHSLCAAAVPEPSKPMSAGLLRCACAASGHTAAAPPSSATNPRRPMPDMGGPSLRDYRTLNLPPTDRQVPVADLNCSESRSAPTVDQRLRDAGPFSDERDQNGSCGPGATGRDLDARHGVD